MSPKHDKKFLKLKREWYKKLEKSGFRDIETDKGDLKRYDSAHFNSLDVPLYQTTQRYYQLAAQTLHDYPFISDKDRKIWALHAQGYTVAMIIKEAHSSRRYIEGLIERVSKWVRV